MSDGAANRPEPVLVRDGGAQFAPVHGRDPLEAWVDLMDAVEALCPEWPERAARHHAAGFRL